MKEIKDSDEAVAIINAMIDLEDALTLFFAKFGGVKYEEYKIKEKEEKGT